MKITLRRWTNVLSKSVIEINISIKAQIKVTTRCHPVWMNPWKPHYFILLSTVLQVNRGGARQGETRDPDLSRRHPADPRRSPQIIRRTQIHILLLYIEIPQIRRFLAFWGKIFVNRARARRGLPLRVPPSARSEGKPLSHPRSIHSRRWKWVIFHFR